jgi:hypothetical protein
MSERPATAVLRMATAFMFGYEAAALFSGGRVPTISNMCARHRWLTGATVAGLTVHLVLYARDWDARWEILLPDDCGLD